MVGFIRGLFGGKGQPADPARPLSSITRASSTGREFYLDRDDAQSLGNTSYIRTAKAIKRTFPKTVNNEEMEVIQEISSLQSTKVIRRGLIEQKVQVQSASGASATSPAKSASTDADLRRSNDSSLDPFRAMVRDLRKK